VRETNNMRRLIAPDSEGLLATRKVEQISRLSPFHAIAGSGAWATTVVFRRRWKPLLRGVAPETASPEGANADTVPALACSHTQTAARTS